MTQPERNRSRSTEAADIARRRFLPQAARSLGTFRYLCVRAGHSSGLAEREGFEPPIGLHLCRISSAVHSTTPPPLQAQWRMATESLARMAANDPIMNGQIIETKYGDAVQNPLVTG
jgi:hypothetical protein